MKLTVFAELPETVQLAVSVEGERKLLSRKDKKGVSFDIGHYGVFEVEAVQPTVDTGRPWWHWLLFVLLLPFQAAVCLVRLGDDKRWYAKACALCVKSTYRVDVQADTAIHLRYRAGYFRERAGRFVSPSLTVIEKDVRTVQRVIVRDRNAYYNAFASLAAQLLALAVVMLALFGFLGWQFRGGENGVGGVVFGLGAAMAVCCVWRIFAERRQLRRLLVALKNEKGDDNIPVTG